MRIPIRMIGIATTFFWIFLIAFAISAVSSIKDMQLNFGEPQMSAISNNRVQISLPITVGNGGYYNIGYFNMTTEILGSQGQTVTRGSTLIPVIRKGENVTALHNITVDISELMQADQNYLFNDTDLRIYASLGMRLAELIPVQASTNMSMPWGAPLYNFALGTPQYSIYNATHSRVVIPVSFENHAFFDLAGDLQLRMFNSGGSSVGEGQTSVGVPQGSFFNGQVELYVQMNGVTPQGHFEVSFLSPIFNYGPWVIPYG